MRRSRREDDWALSGWLKKARTPLADSADLRVSRLISAAQEGLRVEIVYNGGSTPGATRWIRPRRIFQVEGYGAYVEAFCEKRAATRTFSVSRIQFTSSQPEKVAATSEHEYSSHVGQGSPQGDGCLCVILTVVLTVLVTVVLLVNVVTI